MKIKIVLLSLVLAITLLAGCGANEESEQNEPEPNEPEETTPDVVTTASIVIEEEAFKNAISADGTWIICTLKDFEFDEDLIVEGEFRDKGEAENELYRKVALYTQDEDRNKTASFELKAPKITIRSVNTKIQGGKVIGDVYVEAQGFQLVDAIVEGNVYFANEEYNSTFELGEGATVTGSIEVKEQ